jgi:hypothetical protein
VARVTDQELLPRPPAADDAAAAGAGPARPARRWCLGTWLVLAATVGWLQFVVVHQLLSGRTWLWAQLDLIPPVVFAVIPLLLLAVAPFARPIRWRVIAVVALAGVLGAGNSGINLASLWHDPPPAPRGAITVVSWNTEFWDQNWREAGGHSLDQGFYRYLRDLDADVYLLKEYLHIKPTEPLGRHNAFAIDRLDELRTEFPGFHIAVSGKQITISRYPIVAHRGLDLRPWLPEDKREVPPDQRNYPGYFIETLRTDLLVDGTVMSVYNTHVSQPGVDWRLYRGAARHEAREDHHRRDASFRALRADVDGNQHPVVVGADLNTSPAGGMLRLLPDRLVDQTRALESIYPTTWVFRVELWQIDWLLTTPDVTVHQYDLVDPAGLSDHRVQRAVLSTESNSQM